MNFIAFVFVLLTRLKTDIVISIIDNPMAILNTLAAHHLANAILIKVKFDQYEDLYCVVNCMLFFYVHVDISYKMFIPL